MIDRSLDAIAIARRILLLLTGALFSMPNLRAVEVTEFAGGAHGFPALLDSSGKKQADGDFSQWLEGEQLRIRIVYEFKGGDRIEEQAAFRQKPELVLEEWSWRENPRRTTSARVHGGLQSANGLGSKARE